MVLHAYGQTLSPDDLYAKYGRAKAQEPSGVAAILRSYGLGAVATKSGDRATLKAHLAKGLVAVVHGDWTDNGHCVVFKGMEERGWLVNDPAGNWEDCYDCASRGDGVAYEFGGKFDQLLSHDGDVWYTLVDGP